MPDFPEIQEIIFAGLLIFFGLGNGGGGVGKVSCEAKSELYFCLYRCREKQRKEASRLQTVNRKLTAMNKLLMEENDRLQKQVSHLVCENGYMRQQLQSVG